MHALVPAVLLGMPGSMSSGRIPRRIHHTLNGDRRPRPIVAKGTPLSVRIRSGSPNSRMP